MERDRRMPVLAALLLTMLSPCLSADVRLHGLFTDNAVLQREVPLLISGTGDNGEAVVVTIGDQSAETVVRDGAWQACLKPMAAGGPYSITVRGKNTVKCRNILIGDVWVCSGQSNMETTIESYKNFGVKEYRDHKHLFSDVPGTYHNRLLRLFKVARVGADAPRHDVETDKRFGNSWLEADSNSVMQFSATGFFFGAKIQTSSSVPQGLIYCAVGGTGIESWTPAWVMSNNQIYATINNWYNTCVKRYPEYYAEYEKKLLAWQELRSRDRQKAGTAPQPPMGPTNDKRPAAFYNAMVEPLMGYRIKGVIWYQGENNTSRPKEYRDLLPLMIRAWRTRWGIGDFPFLFVQLAGYKEPAHSPGYSAWALLREAQTMALTLSNTGMAVAIDAGTISNIHPPFKRIVGERLAYAALKAAYGRPQAAHVPQYDSMTVSNVTAWLRFSDVGAGLIISNVTLDSRVLSTNELRGFQICGNDRKFRWAHAEIIDSNTIIVSSPDVAEPLAVRYAWADFPLCNLYNKEGFPAAPFRTDTFDEAP